MSKPKLLDLFCCEGGAALGYAEAGFEVYGVDLTARFKKRYPFAFHHGDALTTLQTLLVGDAVTFAHKDGTEEHLYLRDFEAIHASPPCQAYSITKNGHSKEYPQLIEPVRDLLTQTKLPYVIENVVGAPLQHPTMLCGSHFGLTAQDTDPDKTTLRLERHRLFETNFHIDTDLLPYDHHHDKQVPVGGVYGGGRTDRWEAKNIRKGGYTPPDKSVRAALIGVSEDHMTLHGLNQSVPPVYTEFIGGQLRELLDVFSD